MYNVTAAVATTDTPLPTGSVFGHMNATSTDSAGAVQVLALNGSETPTPWAVTFNGLADGPSSFVFQSVDATGAALLAPWTATYSPVGTPTFPLPTGVTFTAA